MTHYNPLMLTASDIKHFPSAPGVYLMRDDRDRIIYVGKAINLKKRVSSYFTRSSDSRYQIRFLMQRVVKIDWLVTDTEKEALLLENSLIKEHRPRYNLSLRDDKTYFSLRLDPKEDFPRITIVRKVQRDGAKYFGPYSSAASAREVLKEMCRIFPLRHHPLKNCMQRRRPCLYHQLKQCSAPCFGLISANDYRTLVEGAAHFLAGRNREITGIYKARMAEAAEKMEYEEAGRYRDLIRAIEETVENQKVSAIGGDSDVLGMSADRCDLQFSILFIRNGLLLGSSSYHFDWELDESEALSAFVSAYYSQDVIIPDEIILPLQLEEHAALAELLGEKRGRKVTISCPHRGAKAGLVRMAEKNAANAAMQRKKRIEESSSILDELQSRLMLARRPERIECYDISNIQGEMAVGSQVTFAGGRPDKKSYRRYRIKSVGQADDFAMLREVFQRRFREQDTERPDLIIVDGGIGQLGVLSAVMDELGISGVDLAGLAKSRVESDMKSEQLIRSEERVFLPGRKNPVALRQNSPALLLLARIRDEAHRFAVTYHRQLRSKKGVSSALDQVQGLGPAKRKALLLRFGSVAGIKAATSEELISVKGVTAALAERILKGI